MTAPEHNQRLKLTVRGDSFRHGDVPITVIASKLLALQNLVFHAAATVNRDSRIRRGHWANRYRPVAELFFSASHHSELVIEAELPPKDGFLSKDMDLGAEAIDLVFQAAAAVSEAPGRLVELVASKDDRAFLLRAIEALCPSVTDDYEVVLENSSPRHQPVMFSRMTRESIREVISEQTSLRYGDEEVTVVGTLTKIHIESAPELIAVRLERGNEVNCYYPDSMRDQIANLLAGSTVEVTGLPTMDSSGNIQRLDTVSNVETIGMEPLRLSKFEANGKRYKLKEPLLVDVEYTNGAWVYSNPAVNLWGYGIRREEAVLDLHETFDYIWREFALEKDEALDGQALTIKRRLLEIVEIASPGDTHAPRST